MLICHLYIFFGEVSVRSLAKFLIGLFVVLLSLKSSWYILDTSPSPDMFFCKYFLLPTPRPCGLGLVFSFS